MVEDLEVKDKLALKRNIFGYMGCERDSVYINKSLLQTTRIKEMQISLYTN